MTKTFLFHPFFSAGNLSCDWLCWPLQKKWWQRNLESTENWVNVAAKRSTVTAATDSWWLCSRLRFLLWVAGNGCQMADRKSSRISGCLWGHPGDISTKCGHFHRICGVKTSCFSREVGRPPSVIVATKTAKPRCYLIPNQVCKPKQIAGAVLWRERTHASSSFPHWIFFLGGERQIIFWSCLNCDMIYTVIVWMVDSNRV